jgi:amidase
MKFRYLLLTVCICQSLFACAQLSEDSNHSSRAKRIIFNPEAFYNSFSANVNPALHINSGDTVVTETIDASGRDKNGVKRQRGGNPLTGPFFINEAKAGDLLKINLIKIALNRKTAFTSESFVSRSMPDSVSRLFKKPKLVNWILDIQNGLAYADTSYTSIHSNLRQYSVPVHPFLGCIGVAPLNNKNEILSFFQGEFGGNLDFSGIKERTTVYLPLFHDGAYFYIGDGHAAQGDGEIAGNALETSLDVEFSVELIKNSVVQLTMPAVEDSQYMMFLGSGRSLDEAIKVAGIGLLDWLKSNYRVTMEECTQVMSTGIEYRIAEIADPNVIVVAAMIKTQLQKLVHQ